MRRVLYAAIPLLIFMVIAFFLWRGLDINPSAVPSVLIGQPVPNFHLPDLENDQAYVTQNDFVGEVSLLNVWATWCPACHDEHPVLMDIARTGIVIYGLNYKDNWLQAEDWLQHYGNPYRRVAFDQDGSVAIHWGVYGAPETFLIDQQGIIRYKYVGTLTQQVWQETLLPLVEQLQQTG